MCMVRMRTLLVLSSIGSHRMGTGESRSVIRGQPTCPGWIERGGAPCRSLKIRSNRWRVGRAEDRPRFRRDAATDCDDATIVTAVIGLAHNLKLRVIARRRRNPAHVDFLRLRG